MKKTRKLQITITFCVIAVLVGSWYWVVKVYPKSHSYLDAQLDYVSEVIPEKGPFPSKLFWLNDETLVFVGLKGERKTYFNNWEDLEYFLFKWKFGEKEQIIDDPDLHKWLNNPKSSVGGVCAAKGRLVYTISREKFPPINDSIEPYTISTARIVTNGEVFEKRYNSLEYQNKKQPGYVFKSRPRTCQSSLLKGDKSLKWTVWPDGQTKLIIGKVGTSTFKPIHPYILKPAGEKIFLDIPAEESSVLTVYSEFDNSFVTVPTTQLIRHYSADECVPFWRIWKDGRVKRECFLRGYVKSQVSPWVRVTKAGIFFANNMSRGGVDMLRNKNKYRLFDGAADKPVVSPDGCKVAFNYVASFKDADPTGRGWRVGVIDFCNKKL